MGAPGPVLARLLQATRAYFAAPLPGAPRVLSHYAAIPAAKTSRRKAS
jgi:hypothetical protein